MLSNILRKPHVKKNFGSLSRGQKGQNPPHSSDLEKKSKFSKKNCFAFFCELNHSEQENQKTKKGKKFSLLTFDIPDTWKKNQNFQKTKFLIFFSISILMILILNFHFTRFRFRYIYGLR